MSINTWQFAVTLGAFGFTIGTVFGIWLWKTLDRQDERPPKPDDIGPWRWDNNAHVWRTR